MKAPSRTQQEITLDVFRLRSSSSAPTTRTGGETGHQLEKATPHTVALFVAISLFAEPLYTLTLIFRSSDSFVLTAVALLSEAFATWFLHVGLVRFSKSGLRQFLLPAKLTLFFVIGIPITYVSFALIDEWRRLSVLAGTVSTVPYLGLLVAGEVTLLVGIAFAAIGIAGGMLGIWRIGKIYNELSIGLGGLLAFVPYVNVAGVLLLLFGLRRTKLLSTRVNIPD